jgi:hypothetical protein
MRRRIIVIETSLSIFKFAVCAALPVHRPKYFMASRKHMELGIDIKANLNKNLALGRQIDYYCMPSPHP